MASIIELVDEFHLVILDGCSANIAAANRCRFGEHETSPPMLISCGFLYRLDRWH